MLSLTTRIGTGNGQYVLALSVISQPKNKTQKFAIDMDHLIVSLGQLWPEEHQQHSLLIKIYRIT